MATHDEAINVLRQTPQCVQLIIFRDEGQYKEEELWDTLTVEFQRKPGHSLGLSIVGRRYTLDSYSLSMTMRDICNINNDFALRNDTGVFVSDIVKGGVVESDGRLMQGDQILSVNREDVRCATQEYVAALLKVNVTYILYECMLSYTFKNRINSQLLFCVDRVVLDQSEWRWVVLRRVRSTPSGVCLRAVRSESVCSVVTLSLVFVIMCVMSLCVYECRSVRRETVKLLHTPAVQLYRETHRKLMNVRTQRCLV